MEFTIGVDHELLEKLYKEEINKRLDLLENETLLMNMKQLCESMNLSRPTVEKIFIKNPDFPTIKINSKYMFHRKEVSEFLVNWSKEERRSRNNERN